MSLIWLAAWLIRRRPRVQMFREWNNWGIALAVALGLDVLSSISRAPRAHRRADKKVAVPAHSEPVGVS